MRMLVRPHEIQPEEKCLNVHDYADETSTIETVGPKTPTISPVTQNAPSISTNPPGSSSTQSNTQWLSKAFPPFPSDLEGVPEPVEFSNDLPNGADASVLDDDLAGPTLNYTDRALLHNPDELALFGEEWKWEPL
jgi:hypothetical protein